MHTLTWHPHYTFHKRHLLYAALAIIIAALIAGRLYLNVWAKDYVNEVLNRIPGYEGSIERIDIDLYRGAYRVHQLKVFKKTGGIPVPFVDIATTDLSIQWGALFRGRIVSDVDLEKPVINFAKSGSASQTGAGVDWTKPIEDLMPIDINVVTFNNGKLTYRDFSTNPKVNLYIDDMSGELRNLRNVRDKEQALPSTIIVKGKSIGGGALDIRGKLNILKPIPDMDLNAKLERVNLPALSNYTDAYAKVDIEKGTLNVYSEIAVKNGRVSGYVKPIATDISLISLREETNPIKLAWESIVSVVVEIFTNQPRDQFATTIPLEGNLGNIDTNILVAIGGIVRNAFFEAVKKGFDGEK